MKNNPFIQKVDDIKLIEFYWELIKFEKIANLMGLILGSALMAIFLIYFYNYNFTNFINWISFFVSWVLSVWIIKYSFVKVFKRDLDKFVNLDDEELKRLEIFDRALQKGQKVFINIKTGEVFIE